MGFIRNLHAPRGFIADRIVYSYRDLEIYAGRHGIVVTELDTDEDYDLTFYRNTIYFFDNPDYVNRAIEIMRKAYRRYYEEERILGLKPNFVEPFGEPAGIVTWFLSFKEAHILIVDDDRLLELIRDLSESAIIDPDEEVENGAIYVQIPEGSLKQEHVVEYCMWLERQGKLGESVLVSDCVSDILDKLAETWKNIVGDPLMPTRTWLYRGREAYIKAKPYLPEHEDHWLNYMYNVLGVDSIFSWMERNDNERKYILMVNKELEKLLKKILYL